MSKGRYGRHGGQYIPETLMNAVLELERAYDYYKNEPQFMEELQALYREYANRPSLLYFAEKMTRDLGGAKIYLKREDLNHTGSHKINNVLGQVLLAKKMGKKRVIAETGAGQHGVATATAAALMDMECVVYMGKEDTERQALNVFRMELLGAKVVPVETGTMTLKDAVNEALRSWTTNVNDTYYVLGSVMGPHPYPEIVRDFQRVIGKEVKEQMLAKEGRLPDIVMACVGGVKKGAFDEAEAQKRFDAWKNGKDAKASAVRENEAKAKKDAAAKELEAEKKVNEAIAKKVADKKAAEAAAKAEAEAAATEEAAPADEAPAEA